MRIYLRMCVIFPVRFLYEHCNTDSACCHKRNHFPKQFQFKWSGTKQLLWQGISGAVEAEIAWGSLSSGPVWTGGVITASLQCSYWNMTWGPLRSRQTSTIVKISFNHFHLTFFFCSRSRINDILMLFILPVRASDLNVQWPWNDCFSLRHMRDIQQFTEPGDQTPSV